MSGPGIVEFTEPGFHSLARAPRDSRPMIAIEHEGAPCVFTIEFGAGATSVKRIVMTGEARSTHSGPSVIRADELLFARVIPPGLSVEIVVRWNPAEPWIATIYAQISPKKRRKESRAISELRRIDD